MDLIGVYDYVRPPGISLWTQFCLLFVRGYYYWGDDSDPWLYYKVWRGRIYILYEQKKETSK